VDGNAGETAEVLGVIGASEDGSSVYFVAHGVLGDAGEHGAVPGNNLYLERYDDAKKGWAPPEFVAALANGDEPDWQAPRGENLAYMTSRVSPNGRYLAFMSEK